MFNNEESDIKEGDTKEYVRVTCHKWSDCLTYFGSSLGGVIGGLMKTEVLLHGVKQTRAVFNTE